MRFLIIVLFLILHPDVRSYKSEKVFGDAKTGAKCNGCENNDDKFENIYDDSMFFKALTRTNETELTAKNKVLLNCFGLNGNLANLVESFLKNEANGTKALKVLFYSRSRSNPRRRLVQRGQGFSMKESDFDIRRRTVFIVHGFFGNADGQWIIDMEKALLTWDDLNLFVVDWSDGSSTLNYFKAAVNTKTVGDQIATFINQIINNVIGEVEPRKWGPLHLIGHSLGAHICGYTSHQLKLRGNQWPVYRITGLDPAQPCFRNSDLSLRLDKSDAHFVDVIHTNGRILSKLGLGLPYPLGHVDFYPNGGRVQPGCFFTESKFWNYMPTFIKEIKITMCSHGRSQIYFTESIYAAVEKNCTFWAQEWDLSFDSLQSVLSSKCDVRNRYRKCVEMGINAEKYQHNGAFFALTESSSPFCSPRKRPLHEIMTHVEKSLIDAK